MISQALYLYEQIIAMDQTIQVVLRRQLTGAKVLYIALHVVTFCTVLVQFIQLFVIQPQVS